MKIQVAGAVSLYSFRLFDPWPELVQGAFARGGGVSQPPYDSLNVSYAVRDDPRRVEANRETVARAVGWEPRQVVSARQVHGRNVAIVGGETVGAGELPEADALVTDQRGTLLMMKFADCVPIILWDPVSRVVALAHAGWRGTVLGTPAAAVETMVARYGSRAADLLAGIGPSIGPCCYQVGSDVALPAARAFPGTGVLLRETGSAMRLDLWAANAETLMRAGLAEENIAIARICTRCRHDLFFSHRAARGLTGRFAVVAGIRNE